MNTPQGAPAAVIYCRISEDRKGEEAGVTRQREDSEKLAAQRGLRVVEVLTDNDLSAKGKKRRPAFEQLLTMLAAGQVRVVIAWTWERLERNRRDSVRLIEAGQAAGATIALVRGNDLDMGTPAGRFVADLLSAQARNEIDVKGDRQSRQLLQAAEQGKWTGGRRPFGYEKDGVTIRENEAEAVRTAYWALLQGVSLRQIATGWNAAGFLTPQLSRRDNATPVTWSGNTVSRCLRKARYAGLRSHKGEILGKAEWPALVDADTWHTVQALLRDPTRRPTRGDQALLTGVALCGGCGHPVHAGSSKTATTIYRCARPGPAGDIRHVSRSREQADNYVREVAIARLSRPDAAVFDTGQSHVDRGALVREADGIRQRLDGLAEAYADGDLSDSQLRAGTKRLRATLADVEQRLASTSTAGENALRSVASAEDVAAAWDALTTEARRQILDLLMIITLHSPGRGARGLYDRETGEWHLDPATVDIEWKGQP